MLFLRVVRTRGFACTGDEVKKEPRKVAGSEASFFEDANEKVTTTKKHVWGAYVPFESGDDFYEN